MKIPTYESKVVLTTEAPAPKITEGAGGIIGEAMVKAGQTITAFAEAQRQAESNYEFSQAKNLGYGAREQTELDFSTDNDFPGLIGRAEQRTQADKEKILADMRNAEAKRKFTLDYDFHTISTLKRIRDAKTKRFVERYKVSSNEEINNATKALLSATNDTDRETAFSNLGAIMQQGVEDKIFTSTEGGAIYNKIIKDLPSKQATYDTFQKKNPKETLRKLNAGEYGLKESDPEEWAKLKKQAEARLAQNTTRAEKAFEKKQVANAIGRAKSLADGIPQIQEIEDDMLSGVLSYRFATVLKQAILSPEVYDPTPKGKAFIDILDRLLADDAQEEVLALLELATREYAKGNITGVTAELDSDDYGYFISEANKRFNGEPPNPFFKNAFETIKKWAFDYGMLPSPYDPFDTIMGMTRELIVRWGEVIASGKDDPGIELEAQKIIEIKQKEMFPGYEMEDLKATANKRGITIKQVFDTMEERKKD